ncbi:PH domain-containing protein [Yinghuangia soli]|uniref:PH domain-containing protein n=1 Tax=Yinghuangia soli TaxID=2908204 RepID=A0AA41Q1G5_9ACTN|nr:PH domain-containing protein [Yinghuangia soli]MCF2529804.1 PH domain-containing protein [Yinghuangia soli]
MNSDESVTTYRSKPALFTGVVMVAVGLWLIVDSALRGTGGDTVTIIGSVLAAGALVVALTIRAAMYAGPDKLLIRNPFRTVEIPWGAVQEVKAEYSLEVRADDRSFHIWAVPVSLRERKRAIRANSRSLGEDPYGSSRINEPVAATADHAVADIRGMAEQFAKTSTGPVRAVWCWPVFAAIAVGAGMVVLGTTL